MDCSSADGVFIQFSPKDPSEHHIMLLCTEAVVFQTSYLEPTHSKIAATARAVEAHHLFSSFFANIVFLSFCCSFSHQTSFLKLCFYLSPVCGSLSPIHCSPTSHTIRSKPNKDLSPYLHFHVKHHVAIEQS